MIIPTVSVVIPAARADRHLTSAIESALAQDLDDADGLEVVVVLDGLDPGSTPLPRDDRLVVVAIETRSGTPRALNAGLAAARGEFVARLDADDVALPGRLRAQLDVLRRRPDLVCLGSSVRLIDSADRPLGTLDAPRGPGLSRQLLHRNVLTHSATTYRRSAVLAAGAYDPSCVRMQDYDLWLRLALLGDVDNLAEPLTAYRLHPAQQSRRTPPWGPSARSVLRSRRRLASHLGRGPLRQSADDALWSMAQVARHLGLRRPAYLSHLSRQETT